MHSTDVLGGFLDFFSPACCHLPVLCLWTAGTGVTLVVCFCVYACVNVCQPISLCHTEHPTHTALSDAFSCGALCMRAVSGILLT